MWRTTETFGSQSWRGGPRGRGTGGGRGRAGYSAGLSARGGYFGSSAPKSAIAASQEPPLGPLLLSWTRNEFNQEAKNHEPKSFITDLKTVASYNWLDRTEPTIVIPGKPPKWTPLVSPRQLQQDDGQYFRDVNSANFPKHPMEPTIIAAVTMNPDVSRQIDIVACGSTIGNLLRFLQGEDKSFRILVELVGETLFFIRRENTPRELIQGVYGYGHTFPESYTTWEPEVKGSTSHQRIISYRFGGLGFLVRFEVDGYITSDDSDDEDAISKPPHPRVSDINTDLDLLSVALTENRVTSKVPEYNHGDLQVLRGGKLISQTKMFDLKTRSIRKKEPETFEFTLNDQLKRLWVAQIPNFILAYHTRGVFDDINVKPVQDEVSSWENDHVDELSRLAALMHHIIDLVRVRPDKKLELRLDAVGILEVREQLAGAGDALSRSVREMWENGIHQETRRVLSSDESPQHGGDSSKGSEDDGWEDDLDPDYTAEHNWEDDFEPDYTACSAHDCGYCGKCSY